MRENELRKLERRGGEGKINTGIKKRKPRGTFHGTLSCEYEGGLLKKFKLASGVREGEELNDRIS